MTCRLYAVCLSLVVFAGCWQTPEETPGIPVNVPKPATGGGADSKPASKFESTRKAAEQRHATAQFMLGAMYGLGDGVPRDAAEAAKWYLKAAEQGHAPAQSALGVLYATGAGATKDVVESYAWYSVADAHSPGVLKGILSAAETALTPEQLAAGKKRAEELTEQINANTQQQKTVTTDKQAAARSKNSDD
jgi:TPR repeat protein